MTEAFRVKGWCPGALAPMASGDGLIVRVRVSGGRLTADAARALASLADRAGNGLIELTQRANLQLRGVTSETLPMVQADLARLGLIDADAAHEAIRNIIVAPTFAEEDGVQRLARDLEAGLRAAEDLTALPAKFGFAVDGGDGPGLGAARADVHLSVAGDVVVLALPAGGDLHAVGAVPLDGAAEAALGLARAFLALRGDARRMRDLTARIGAAAVARGVALRPVPPGAGIVAVAAREDLPPTFLQAFIPLGVMTAAQFACLADLATRPIRLAPWRAVFIAVDDMSAARAALARAGLSLDADAPARAVVACAGRPGCPHGETPARTDALALADAAALLPGTDIRLHVSGCGKGCAHPRPAAATLVGRGGAYDLIWNGAPGDPPALTGLSLAAARLALETRR